MSDDENLMGISIPSTIGEVVEIIIAMILVIVCIFV